MNISVPPTNNFPEFKELENGDAFTHESKVYIKMRPILMEHTNAMTCNAVELATGEVVRIPPSDHVCKMKGRFVYTGE